MSFDRDAADKPCRMIGHFCIEPTHWTVGYRHTVHECRRAIPEEHPELPDA